MSSGAAQVRLGAGRSDAKPEIVGVDAHPCPSQLKPEKPSESSPVGAAPQLGSDDQARMSEKPTKLSAEDKVEKEYAEFMEKVKKTVYIDCISHKVTKSVIKMALEQCATVVRVEFVKNYTVPFNIPASVLVELESPKQAKAVVEMLSDFPFMMSGMPRPARARLAVPEMFPERPKKPRKKVQFCRINTSDPNYKHFIKSRELLKRHELENLALIKTTLDEDLNLAKLQQESLDTNMGKHDKIENLTRGRSNILRLGKLYGMELGEIYHPC